MNTSKPASYRSTPRHEPPSICESSRSRLSRPFPWDRALIVQFQKYKVNGYLLDTWSESQQEDGKNFRLVNREQRLRNSHDHLGGRVGPDELCERWTQSIRMPGITAAWEIKPG